MIDIKTHGDKIVITIDINETTLAAATRSASGKSLVVASTNGFTNVETPRGGLSLSLNLIKKGKA